MNYPSAYGSHRCMINEEETKRIDDESLVICNDERGLYVTERKNLDSGLADQNRFSSDEYRNKKLKEITGQIFEIVKTYW